jgi:hypothetical protein
MAGCSSWIGFSKSAAVGIETEFNPVKCFSGIIFRKNEHLNDVLKILQGRFSVIDLESDIFPFDMTAYYEPEMGFPLFRKFVSFERLMDPQQLPAAKLFSNRIEEQFSDRGKRQINVDPGFVSDANVIIATTKNHYHRIPLRNGIYAHMEYTIRKKTVSPLDWTYPDFRKPEYMNFFNRLIERYKSQALTKSD